MNKLYICNTHFEAELEDASSISDVYHSFHTHPIYLQLQFLPLLFTPSTTALCFTEKPSDQYLYQLQEWGFPQHPLYTFDKPPQKYSLSTWGFSPLFAQWARKHHLSYIHPEWSLVSKLNSKTELPKKNTLHNEKDWQEFSKNIKYPFVLKTAFGVSGRGHRILQNSADLESAKLKAFRMQQWELGHGIIAEAFVDRIFDFSSHWFLTKELTFLNTTQIQNTPKGAFQSISTKQQTPYQHFIDAHCHAVKPLLHSFIAEGYHGPVSIDAMLYHPPQSNEILMETIVEVNARSTFASIALELQQRFFSNQNIELSYAKGSGLALLPCELKRRDGKVIKFKKQLYLNPIPL